MHRQRDDQPAAIVGHQPIGGAQHAWNRKAPNVGVEEPDPQSLLVEGEGEVD